MVLAYWLILVFVTGASVGSFLNVCVARLPFEKSLLWPNSRCGNCLQSIRWYDNLPIISYLWLLGRCRTCGQRFSVVYMLVELGTALAFVALFLLEVTFNVHDWPGHNDWNARNHWYPFTSWVGFIWHALLMAFLIVASVCDLKSREIPLSLTLTGTLVGLIGAALMPWPWPQSVGIVIPEPAPASPFQVESVPLHHGVYAWPFWGPLPSWCGEGEMLTGILTGVVGALVGTFMLRSIGFVFSKGLRKDALGLGDADLMMMAGAFLGWQIIVVAFFLSAFPAMIFGIINWFARNDNSLPFGPSLAFSVIATSLLWRWIGEPARVVFFWNTFLFFTVVAVGSAMFVMAFVIRTFFYTRPPDA